MEGEVCSALEKTKKSALELSKEQARNWWDEISLIYFALCENDDEENYKIENGRVQIDRRIETETSIKQAADKRISRKCIKAESITCLVIIACAAGIILNVNVEAAKWLIIFMLPIYAIIKILEKIYKPGSLKFYEDKDTNLGKLDKAIELFATANKWEKEEIISYIFGGYEKKRRIFLNSLHFDNIAIIVFSAYFLPGFTELLDEKFGKFFSSLSSLSQDRTGIYFLIDNMFEVSALLLIAIISATVIFVGYIFLQFAVNILGNDISRIISEDALLSFYKECRLNDWINRSTEE